MNPVAVADLDDETSVARAAMVAMDAGAFGADRTNVLETWRNTCPDLALCAPGMAYSLTHVRGDTAAHSGRPGRRRARRIKTPPRSSRGRSP